MRLFVAVNPGEPVRAEVATFLDSIRDRWNLKWVRPESLHVTLKFLGERPGDSLPGLTEALLEAAWRREAFRVGFGPVGVFPSRGRPRVLFLQMDDGGRLGALARRVDEALAPRFPDLDAIGDFHAHLTLGRVRRGGLEKGSEPLESLRAPAFPSFLVDRFELVESRLTPSGPIYRTRGVFTLAAARGT